MSQSSVYIDSFEHSKRRFAMPAGVAIDPLVQPAHSSIVAPVFPIKRELTPQGTPALGSTVTYKMPNSGYVHQIVLRNQYGTTTTADMSDYPGFSAIDRIEIVCDNEILMEYNYRPMIQYYMSKLKNEEAVDKMLLASGGVNCGTSSAAIWTAVPIPTFFDPIFGNAQPLNLSKLKNEPEVRVTYRAAAACVKATGGGADLATSRIVYYMSDSAPVLKNMHLEQDYFHNSFDASTLINQTVATATETSIDVTGFKGQIKKLMVIASLSSEVAANTYFVNKEIGSIKTDLDGHEQYVFRCKEEAELDALFYNQGKGYNSTLGYPYVIPYSVHTQENYTQHHVGGIHSSKVGKHLLKVTHALGADASVDVIGIRSAVYAYRDGGIVKFQ